MNHQFKVNINNNQESVKVPKGIRMLVRRCCKAVLHEENRETIGNVNIVFAENQSLSELSGNNLAQEREELFVMQPLDKEQENREHLGDVYIALESAMQRSKDYNNSFEAEVVYLTAHAVFLLLGYRDCSVFEKDILEYKEHRIIHELGMTYQGHI